MRRFIARCVCFGFLAATATPFIASCSHHSDPGGDGISPSGTLAMTLRTTAPSGTEYRLRDGTFNITGHSSAVVSTEDDPDAAAIRLQLEVGDYFVMLASGWFLEKVTGNGTFEPIEATLLSSNPQAFGIVDQQTTEVRFRFQVAGEVVELTGNLSIAIDVEERPRPQCGSMGEVARPIFTELGRLGAPDLVPNGIDTWPTAVTDDGGMVVGASHVTYDETHAFSWTEADGMIDLASDDTGLSDVLAINCDASVIVFNSASPERAIWTPSEGLRPLLGCPGLPISSIEAMSQTGDVLAGTCQTQDPFLPSFPARWRDFEQPGMQLPGLTGWAFDVSADGKVFAGYTQDGLVFRWSEAQGTQLIAAPEALSPPGLSGDGRCVFTTDAPDEGRPFRWCDADITPIPLPSGVIASGRIFVNHDGTLAVVNDATNVWVWHEEDGTTRLLDTLAAAHVDLRGWDTLRVTDMTPDGRVLVGLAYDSSDWTRTAAFRLVMPR